MKALTMIPHKSNTISQQNQIKTTLKRQYISCSSEKNIANKASIGISSNDLKSLFRKVATMSIANFNTSVLAKRSQEKESFNSKDRVDNQIQPLELGNRKISNNTYSIGDGIKTNKFNHAAIPFIVQKKSNIPDKTLRQIFDNYSKNRTPANFERLYTFQRNNRNTGVIKNITALRKRLVRDVERLYDKINLNGASIVYSHSSFKIPETGGLANAVARGNSNQITVYKEGMNQEVNSFLNTIRHEGYHIAQFNARRKKIIPKLGNKKANSALLEFLSEYREIVGGFNEKLGSLNADVKRFVENYELIAPHQLNRRWRKLIYLRGRYAERAIKKRIITAIKKKVNQKLIKKLIKHWRRLKKRNKNFKIVMLLLNRLNKTPRLTL